MRVVFCGFMGAGKTHFLQRISRSSRERYLFADLDQIIFERERISESSLGELIEAKGWDYFRSVESRHLSEYLQQNDNCVLALGGGALSNCDNIKSIRRFENSRLVWINSSFETCYQRIIDDKAERPLLKQGKDRLLELFSDRQKEYAQADLILDEDQQRLINSLDELTIRLSVSN